MLVNAFILSAHSGKEKEIHVYKINLGNINESIESATGIIVAANFPHVSIFPPIDS
jgi:hypothetical protein